MLLQLFQWAKGPWWPLFCEFCSEAMRHLFHRIHKAFQAWMAECILAFGWGCRALLSMRIYFPQRWFPLTVFLALKKNLFPDFLPSIVSETIFKSLFWKLYCWELETEKLNINKLSVKIYGFISTLDCLKTINKMSKFREKNLNLSISLIFDRKFSKIL